MSYIVVGVNLVKYNGILQCKKDYKVKKNNSTILNTRSKAR